MNISSIPQLLLTLIRGQGAGQPPGTETSPPLPSFTPGASYNAKVIEGLGNGRALVEVSGRALDMQLPHPAKAGDTLRLVFLNSAPRPTFALAPGPQAAPISNLSVSQTAQQVNALIRFAQAPAPGAPSTGVTKSAFPTVLPPPSPAPGVSRPILSNPAILLVPAASPQATAAAVAGGAISGLALVAEPVAAGRPSVGTQTSTGMQGVVADRASHPPLLPLRLQQTLHESGLFYESHLRRWVKGEVSLEAIQREPQAGLRQTPGPLADLPELEGMPAEAARLAGRQMLMLEGQPFLWQGQAWPGQGLEWLVEERGSDGGESEATGQEWRSRLRLHLPRLGDVTAELDIGARGLRIRLGAGSTAALAEIEAALPVLDARLKAAELNITSLGAELVPPS